MWPSESQDQHVPDFVRNAEFQATADLLNQNFVGKFLRQFECIITFGNFLNTSYMPNPKLGARVHRGKFTRI